MRKRLDTISFIPRMLLILFIGFITWYTYIVFYTGQQSPLNSADILFYFLPSIIMLILLRIGWRHERFEGLAILLVSFVFLGLYHVYVSLAAFFFLLFTGALFFIDGCHTTYRRR